MQKKYLWSLVCIIGTIIFLYGALHDYFLYGSASYGKIDKLIMLQGKIIFIVGLVCFIIYKFNLSSNVRLLTIKVYLFEAIFVFSGITLILITSLSILTQKDQVGAPGGQWSIGIYFSKGSSPLEFTDKSIENPIITSNDITDIPSEFVADPFIIEHKDLIYMFFEMFNSNKNQGEIACATSNNGFEWKYEGVVINEDFHMSYPYVFKWNNDLYMIPQSSTNSVRLYKAVNFPKKWVHANTLLKGSAFVDTTIFKYNKKWWLYTQTNEDNMLRLYHANSPIGNWIEHPKSPIVKDQNIARPGGNIVLFNEKIIRFAQDCDPYYGNQVWALEIKKLNTNEYEEEIIGDKPILKGYDMWNTRGMHTLSTIRFKDGWIAAVDGY